MNFFFKKRLGVWPRGLKFEVQERTNRYMTGLVTITDQMKVHSSKKETPHPVCPLSGNVRGPLSAKYAEFSSALSERKMLSCVVPVQ